MKRVALVATVMFLFPGVGSADTCLKFKHHTDGFSIMGRDIPASEKINTTWISGDKARIEDGSDTTILMDLNTNTLFFIYNKQKKYAELSLNDILKNAQAAAAGSDATDEEQAGVNAMMQGVMSMMKITATVTPTSEKKTIGTWNCEKYSVAQSMGMAGTTTSELWASQEIKVDPEFYAKFSNFAFVKFAGFKEALQEYKKIKGVPVLITSSADVMGASVKTTQTLQEAKEATAPAGSFEIPKGFKKVAE
jgi:hypothetical protein